MEGDAHRAVRASVGLGRLDHVVHLRISGEDAYDALDRVVPRDLYLRDGQVTQSVLLDEDGRVFADCFLASDEGEFILLAEGPEAAAVTAYLGEHFAGAGEVRVDDRGASHGMIGLDGPYAWELVARLVGPEVIGLPFLTFFHFDEVVCLRAGKTGEYGYLLLAPRAALDGLRAELLELGAPLDIAETDLSVLDLCALENWFFNVRAEGRYGLTPLELQLQWRVSRNKPFVGAEALARRRSSGIERRLTCVVAPDAFRPDDPVVRDGAERGVVLNAGRSPVRGDWVGLALMDLAYAHPGVDGLRVGSADGARTITPPVLANRSLYVNPQVHSYASRHADDFPPLVLR